MTRYSNGGKYTDNDDLSVSLGDKIAGEDQAADVLKMEIRGSSVVISAAATTLVKTGAGHINELFVPGGTLGNVTAYDNVAASGTLLLPTVTPVQGGVLLRNVDFLTGLTIVTAAATVIVGSVR